MTARPSECGGPGRAVGLETGEVSLLLHHARVGGHDLRGLAVQRERDAVRDVRALLAHALDAAHDELEVRDVVALALGDHEEVVLVVRPPVQTVAAVEHEDLERRHPVVVDQRGDLVDVRGLHRREVERVVDERPTLGRGQDLGEQVGVGAALVQVVLPGAHVGQRGGDAALRTGAALGRGVLGQRVVDAPVLVGVDHPGEGQPAAALLDPSGVGAEVRRDRGDAAALDGDVGVRHVLDAGPDDADVADDQVVAHGWTSWRAGAGRTPARWSAARTARPRAGSRPLPAR